MGVQADLEGATTSAHTITPIALRMSEILSAAGGRSASG